MTGLILLLEFVSCTAPSSNEKGLSNAIKAKVTTFTGASLDAYDAIHNKREISDI